MAIAILLMLTTVTFTILIYADIMACQRTCELIESRVIEVVAYARYERNVVIVMSLKDVVSRPFELYVLNSTHLEVRVSLKYFSNVMVKRIVALPSGLYFNYTGLIPPNFSLVFKEVDGKVFVNVRP